MNAKEIGQYLTNEVEKIEKLERKHGNNPRMVGYIDKRIGLLEDLVFRIGKILRKKKTEDEPK